MRLIDKDELIAFIKANGFVYANTLETFPEIDAVPVVRCKDCKHYDTVDCSKGFGWCENMDVGVSDDFYCANGAKITNKETGETYK